MFFDIKLLGDHLVDRNFLSMDNEVIEACVVDKIQAWVINPKSLF